MKQDLPSNCLNCDYPFSTVEEKYCSNCGQLRWTKLTLGSLFKNAISSYFSMDSKFVRTIVPFLFTPGIVAKEYIAGKQQKYLSPFQVYVFFSFLMMLVATTSYFKDWDARLASVMTKENMEKAFSTNKQEENTDSVQVAEQELDEVQVDFKVDSSDSNLTPLYIDSLITLGLTNEEIIKKIDEDLTSPILTGLLEAYINLVRYRGRGLVLIIVSQITIVLLFSLFLTSLFLWLLFRKNPMTYAGHLVNSIYYYSLLFLLVTVFIGLSFLFPKPTLLLIGILLIELALFFTLKNVYQNSWLKTFVKFVVLHFAALMIILPLCTALLASLSVVQMGQW